jgi:hypothetical protein
MAHHARACVSASMRKKKSQRERKQATGKSKPQHKSRCFAQHRTKRAGNLQQRNKNQQSNGNVHGERVKPAQKLLPIGVRMTIEFDEPGQRKEQRT